MRKQKSRRGDYLSAVSVLMENTCANTAIGCSYLLAMVEYIYRSLAENSREVVEFDLHLRGIYVTTVVVTIDLLLCGCETFPCKNGYAYTLTPSLRLKMLQWVQEERRRIKARYLVKTFSGWNESGLAFDEFCDPGDTVDSELVDYFVNIVPPVLMLPFCMQVGEPYSHEHDGKNGYRPTYITFHRMDKDHWQFDGYCFYKENMNRNTCRSSLEESLRKAQEEIKRNVL